jgi:threonine dehydrogenase-like Zn-dependent dehydrogenase
MRRLMEVVRHGRVDFTPLLTHRFSLDEITKAYRIFGERTGRRDQSGNQAIGGENNGKE